MIALHDDASAEGRGWQQVLRAYVEVFGEAAAATAQAAADAAHSPTAEAAALPGVPARLALPEMAAQLARLSTALHPVEAIVDAFASFLQRLPPTLPRDLFDSCVRAAADVDPVYTLLLPKIALKRCLAQRAAPLPPPAAPAAVSATAAAVAAEANARLQTAAWLQWTTNGDPVASLLAEKYWLHQSLAQAAWLLRRLLGRADFDATTLLLPPSLGGGGGGGGGVSGARGGSLVTATFDLLGQNDHGLAYLLLRTGDGAGALGAAAAMPAELDGAVVYAARCLHGGLPMQIDGGDDASGLPLWRAELSLVVRHGELAFHKEEVKHEQRLAHSDAHKAYLRQRREWAAALVEGGGGVAPGGGPALVDAPPRATAPLMVAAIHARHEALVIDEANAEAGGALPPTAASRAASDAMRRLDNELVVGMAHVEGAAEYRCWLELLAARPLGAHEAGAAAGAAAGALGGAAVAALVAAATGDDTVRRRRAWEGLLQSRASAVEALCRRALECGEEEMGGVLPSAADIEAAHLGSVLGVLPEAQPWAGIAAAGADEEERRRRRRRPRRAARAAGAAARPRAAPHAPRDGGGDRARRGDAGAQILPRRPRRRHPRRRRAPPPLRVLRRARARRPAQALPGDGARHARRGVRGGRRAVVSGGEAIEVSRQFRSQEVFADDRSCAARLSSHGTPYAPHRAPDRWGAADHPRSRTPTSHPRPPLQSRRPRLRRPRRPRPPRRPLRTSRREASSGRPGSTERSGETPTPAWHAAE